jgi:NAD(P)-dependent dehydrogenase (short-subunit alcohol dehydrogenase family)
MDTVLTNSHVAVLGGTSGIGLATAAAALDAGARVTVAGRDEQRLARALERLGGRARGERLDATDRAQLDRFFAATGPVDHVVLALGGTEGAGPFASLDIGAVRAGLEGKALPQLSAAQAALPALSDGGSLLFVAAGSVHAALPGTAGLAAINGALAAAVPPLARELAPRRVNAVSPGVIDTPWWDWLGPDDRQEAFAAYTQDIPVPRPGIPEEVAALIVALLANPYVTGTVVPIDGGLRL